MKKLITMMLAFCIILMTSAVYGQQIHKQQPPKVHPSNVVAAKQDPVKKPVKTVKHHKASKHHTVKKPVKK